MSVVQEDLTLDNSDDEDIGHHWEPNKGNRRVRRRRQDPSLSGGLQGDHHGKDKLDGRSDAAAALRKDDTSKVSITLLDSQDDDIQLLGSINNRKDLFTAGLPPLSALERL